MRQASYKGRSCCNYRTYGDIIALEPKHAANAETLSSTMTIPDCNAMIRSMTYDVKRYVGVEGIEGNHQARLESTSTALVPR